MNNKVDPGLVWTIQSFAQALTDKDWLTAVSDDAILSGIDSMGTFFRGHAGRPTVVVKVASAGDQVVTSVLHIACRPGHTQRVELVWSWRQGGWRGWPTYPAPAPCT
jgi:hypothetical protein